MESVSLKLFFLYSSIYVLYKLHVSDIPNNNTILYCQCQK